MGVILDGKTWDVFLLIPGALLGAVFGLIATRAWQQWGGSNAPAPDGPGRAAGAAAHATAHATVNVTFAQTLGGRRRRRRDERSWFDDLEPGELLVVVALGVVAVAALYAFFYEAIQAVLLVLGALGATSALMLLIAVLCAGMRPSPRWVLKVVVVCVIFAGVALFPLAMDAADYPMKAWSEVIALSGERPLEILDHYGAIGIGFTLLHGFGTALAVLAGIFAALVLAGVRAPGAAGGRPVHLVIALAVAMLMGGALIANGRVYRLLNPASYRVDKQDPKVFGLSVTRNASRVVVAASVDERARLDVAVRAPRTRRVVVTRRHRVPAGRVRLILPIPPRAPRRLEVVLRARDDAGRSAPVRRLLLGAPRRSDRRPQRR